MFEVNDLIGEVVREENEARQEETKNRIKALVKIIIDCQNSIEKSSARLLDAKKELEELNVPSEFKLEIK